MPRTLVVPPTTEIAKKWAEVTPGRASYYESETPKAADLWESNTVGAKATYKAAIVDPKIADRFAGGAKGKAGKFKRKVEAVGIARFGPGVAAAEADMRDGFDPYRNELDGMSVPDRGPRGADKNYAIGKKIGTALNKKRLAILGAASS